MASNPITIFTTTYNQLLAQGIASGAAQLCAQTAMQAAMNLQNTRPTTVATSVQPVRSGRVNDTGPTMPPKRSR